MAPHSSLPGWRNPLQPWISVQGLPCLPWGDVLRSANDAQPRPRVRESAG